MAFVASLYSLSTRTDISDVFHWSDDGTAFWTSNMEIFARQILPAHFAHSNYASFVRQLNFYGMQTLLELRVAETSYCFAADSGAGFRRTSETGRIPNNPTISVEVC